MAEPLPAEEGLLALAERWARAEAQVRLLLAQAANGGDRRALLIEALEILLALRGDAQQAIPEAERAYLIALAGTALLLDVPDAPTADLPGLPTVDLPDVPDVDVPDAPGLPALDVPVAERATELGRKLHARLDRAAVTASARTREAFATVTPENLPEAATDAVTGHVDRAGARRPLGAHARMAAATTAAHTVAEGTYDAMTPIARALITTRGGRACAICRPLLGRYPDKSLAPKPPFHVNCDCVLRPDGFSYPEWFEQQRRAAYAEHYAGRRVASTA